MSENDTSQDTQIVVICLHHETGECFLKDVCTETAGGSGRLELNDQRLSFRVIGGDPRMHPEWDDVLKTADKVILLSRFLDVISLEKTKILCQRIPDGLMPNMSIFIYREPNENDYKISCPFCGQKLWIHDKDEHKRGRCPNCKKAFELPSKEDILRNQLRLPEDAGILNTVQGNQETCRNAVKTLLAGKEEPSSGIYAPAPENLNIKASKNATIPINFPQGKAQKED